VHTHTHTHTHTNTHTYTHTHKRTHTHTHTHIHTCTHTHTSTHTHTHLQHYNRPHFFTFAYTHRNNHMHVYKYTLFKVMPLCSLTGTAAPLAYTVPNSLHALNTQPQASAPVLSEGKGKKEEKPLDFLEARWAIDPTTKWCRK